MNTKEFSLMQKLIDYASSSNLDHTSGILAYYLLLNYSKLEKLTLSPVLDLNRCPSGGQDLGHY